VEGGQAAERGARDGSGPANGGGTGADSVLQYLLKNQGKTKYLVAVQDSNSAASYIIETGKPVMSMGGFLGSDPILTLDGLKALVKSNTVRFFQGLEGRGSDDGIASWVQSSCRAVTIGADGSATSTKPATSGASTQAGTSATGGSPAAGAQAGAAGTASVQSAGAAPEQGAHNSSAGGQAGFGGGPQGGGGGFGGNNNQQIYDCAGAVK